MYDTLIIGAGMSGLAAGIRLAHYEQSVCILERHTTIGGLNSFYRLAGRNYDVGLHAVTNFTPKGTRRGPLARLLRQLRFSWDEFELAPQLGSAIVFPGVRLRFDNDIDLLRSEVAREFPRQVDSFERLLARILEYEQLHQPLAAESTRQILSETLTDPLLAEMLLCPLMFYGNGRERDMDFGAFSVMFRSIYLEGLARPFAGVRLVLKKLIRRYKELGGELRLRAGVRQILIEDGAARGAVLDDGTEIRARRILSSAGWVETMRLCDGAVATAPQETGQLSFVETIAVLDRQPENLGHRSTVEFFNDSERFHWEKPRGLVDVRSGVICSPNNFAYETPLPEGIIRLTALANYDLWHSLSQEEYQEAKRVWYERVAASATRFMPDFRPATIATDMFTPTTIRRFTGHDNGAVYGAPRKRPDGVTPLQNLFICGTDQGFVGIIGAMVSGFTIANRHLLSGTAAAHNT